MVIWRRRKTRSVGRFASSAPEGACDSEDGDDENENENGVSVGWWGDVGEGGASVDRDSDVGGIGAVVVDVNDLSVSEIEFVGWRDRAFCDDGEPLENVLPSIDFKCLDFTGSFVCGWRNARRDC